jgi:uncharacterized protein (TIGR03118 family)
MSVYSRRGTGCRSPSEKGKSVTILSTPRRTVRWLSLAAMVLLVPLVAAPANAGAVASQRTRFAEVDLVSDQVGKAQLQDPLLVNPWGLALSPTSALWVANNGTDSSTLYNGSTAATPAVAKVALNVAIPGGVPTGQAFNDTTQFMVTGPAGSGAASFIFVSESGDVTAWSPRADRTNAILAAHVDGAVYKGLALVHTPFGPLLLAADINHARIDVFNGAFQRLTLPDVFFHDPRLPHGYAPFNVVAAGDAVYVSYAKRSADGTSDVDGRGFGFVDRYTNVGVTVHRVASRGTLNAPWGMTIAPASFGNLAGTLLVGNFGDGLISAYRGDRFAGLLRDSKGKPLVIGGLWALIPGTAAIGGPDSVVFSAGTNHEANGLIGKLVVATN